MADRADERVLFFLLSSFSYFVVGNFLLLFTKEEAERVHGGWRWREMGRSKRAMGDETGDSNTHAVIQDTMYLDYYCILQ